MLTTRGGSDLSLPLSHFQSWFEEDSNQGRDAETHGKAAGTFGDVRTGILLFYIPIRGQIPYSLEF